MIMKYELKELVKSKGITHQQISDKTGIERANITRILNGKISPTFTTLKKICDACDIKVEFR